MKLRCLVAAMLLVAALPGAAAAQTNSGLDQYDENPPSADSPDGTPSSDPGSDPGSSSGVAGVSGSATGSGSATSSAGLTEAQAGAAGETAKGELPATGLDETVALAIIGGALLAAGFVLRRRVAAQ